MKFEDLLMQAKQEKQKIVGLEEEVDKLEGELERELKVNKIMQCAWQGPIHMQIQGLLTELTAVEEEITWLEKKVDELKLSLYREEQETRLFEGEQLIELQPQWSQHKPKHLLSRGREEMDKLQSSHLPLRLRTYNKYINHRTSRERMEFFRSSKDLRSMSIPMASGYIAEGSRCLRKSHLEEEISIEKPNKLSEELIQCLIGIYIKLNRDSLGFDSGISSHGPYKNFIQITRNSLTNDCISKCFSAMKKLRFLMHKLCNADLSFLTYQQKLAFWINIYNASIMHAYLRHGLPSTHEKLLTLMNKAAINVGGIVLNALAIEHFILRHPSDSVYCPTDEKETLVRHAYGLKYPEPNITFALCRGSWSSPALKIYTGDGVVNELGKARLEYLEACIGVTSRKKIVVPKLLQWHMREFADDMESLLEWIYSQLPQSASVRRLVRECLNSETKSPNTKKVEIQPYASEFRYLLPL